MKSIIIAQQNSLEVFHIYGAAWYMMNLDQAYWEATVLGSRSSGLPKVKY